MEVVTAEEDKVACNIECLFELNYRSAELALTTNTKSKDTLFSARG